MDSRPDLDTQAKVADRAALSQATIARILSQHQAATLDSLEGIARAFGIQAYELLMPEPMDASLMRGLARLSQADKARILAYIEISAGVPLWGSPHPPQIAPPQPLAGIDLPALT